MASDQKSPIKTSNSDEFNLDVMIEKNIDIDMLDSVRHELRKRDNYVLEETESRNVLMVGRTRSGKSTAVGVIKDLCYSPKEMSIFSDTVNPKFQSFAILNKQDSVKLTLNMIDTPGVFEVKEVGQEARTNDMILRVISQCSQNEITKLHCVIIFASFETGVDDHDVKAIKLFSDMFNGANIIICITRCEDKPTKWKDNIKKQLTKHTDLSFITAEQIFFMGCFDPNTSPLTDKKEIIECYKRINVMRTGVIKKMFECKDPIQIRGLSILKSKISKFKTLCDGFCADAKELMTCQDFKTSKSQLLIQNLSDYQKGILDCAEIWAECDEQVLMIYNAAKQLKVHMKDDVESCVKCTSIFHIAI